MVLLNRVVKPKNQRVKRALEDREAKIHENDKNAMFIRGGKTGDLVSQTMKELYMLKKPLAIMYKKKNITRPLDDQSMVEFYSNKSDASLFLFGSHSKKRPHNLVLGRLYDHHVLDMVELGITKFKSMVEFAGEKIPVNTKPCLVFTGEMFDVDHEYKRLKSMLTDFFHGGKAKNIRLAGLEHVLQFTAVDGKVLIRSYRIQMKKSGSRVPRVELEEIGPALDLVVRRTKLASQDLYKRACKQPKTAKPKKKKNVSQDAFGSKLGRIHMTKQDLAQLQTRKMKGLKRGPLPTTDDEASTEKIARTEENMEV